MKTLKMVKMSTKFYIFDLRKEHDAVFAVEDISPESAIQFMISKELLGELGKGYQWHTYTTTPVEYSVVGNEKILISYFQRASNYKNEKITLNIYSQYHESKMIELVPEKGDSSEQSVGNAINKSTGNTDNIDSVGTVK